MKSQVNSGPRAPTQRGASLCKTESAKAHPAMGKGVSEPRKVKICTYSQVKNTPTFTASNAYLKGMARNCMYTCTVNLCSSLDYNIKE